MGVCTLRKFNNDYQTIINSELGVQRSIRSGVPNWTESPLQKKALQRLKKSSKI
jgi:hypothetical protein